jgi:erythromycin esterase
MGLHLDRLLDRDYLAIALTSGAGRTAALHPDADVEPYGFRVEATDLAPPHPGSVEAGFAAVGSGLALADLRAARAALDLAGGPGPDRIRLDTDYVETPVLEAFDAIAHVPSSSVASDLGF